MDDIIHITIQTDRHCNQLSLDVTSTGDFTANYFYVEFQSNDSTA